jgi:hypothetical protein
LEARNVEKKRLPNYECHIASPVLFFSQVVGFPILMEMERPLMF